MADRAAEPPAQAERQPAAAIPQVPEVHVFSLPEVHEYLRLSRSQRESIRQVLAMTADVLRRLDERLGDADPEQRAQLRSALLEEARRRILEMLTPEQRARWDELQAAG